VTAWLPSRKSRVPVCALICHDPRVSASLYESHLRFVEGNHFAAEYPQFHDQEREYRQRRS